MSSVTSMAGLGSRSDVAQQLGCGLQIPVRIGDMRVAEISAQGGHVPRHCTAVTRALFE